MGNNLSELLDEFHYHEVMDRTYIIGDIIDQHLMQHPVFKAEKEFAEKIEQVGMLLAEAYQIVGNLSHERFEQNKNKE
jgi:UDP-2,3-diacylglucosamine pyrophosphatase LpxH